MRGKMDCYGLTDRGVVREANEDQYLVADLNRSMLVHQTSLSHEDHTRLFGGSQGQLLLVADGMGGQVEGRRASALAVETLARYVLNTMRWFFRLHEAEDAELHEEFRSALEEAQKRIEAAAAANPDCEGMGTTLTMAYLLWPRLYVVHAGDSRCYVQRGKRLHQVTRDHTVAQRMVDSGALPAEEAETSQWSHILYNCIGGGSHRLTTDVYKANLQLGDTLLLCTDGLSKCVPDARIAQVLAEQTSAEQTCRRLVDEANAAGGPDNITVVVAHFREAQEAAAHARHAAAEAEPAATGVPASAGTVTVG